MSWPAAAGWSLSFGHAYYVMGTPRPVRPRLLMCLLCALLVVSTVVSALRLSSALAGPAVSPPASALASALPANAKKLPPDYSKQFNALLGEWAAAHPNQQWGISLRSLDGVNFMADYHDQQPFYPASTYKLLLLMALFDKLPYSSWGISMGKGGLTYSECIDKMIRYSDNACGIALGGFTGWPNIQEKLESMGLRHTNLDTTNSRLQTTAGDLGSYLYSFYANSQYPQAKKFVMSVMSQQVYRAGIPAGSPGCTVYDKIGDLGNVLHDAAIVVCPRVSYILTVMSQGGSYPQIADLARRVNTLAVSAATY